MLIPRTTCLWNDALFFLYGQTLEEMAVENKKETDAPADVKAIVKFLKEVLIFWLYGNFMVEAIVTS